jgi:hypothetical protein
MVGRPFCPTANTLKVACLHLPELKTRDFFKMANFGGGRNSLPPPRLEQFVMTEKLGEGTYATVYKAYRKVTFTHVFAVLFVKLGVIFVVCRCLHLRMNSRRYTKRWVCLRELSCLSREFDKFYCD